MGQHYCSLQHQRIQSLINQVEKLNFSEETGQMLVDLKKELKKLEAYDPITLSGKLSPHDSLLINLRGYHHRITQLAGNPLLGLAVNLISFVTVCHTGEDHQTISC